MSNDNIEKSIEFMQWVLSCAKTPEDIEFCVEQLLALNKLLSMEP